MNANSVISRRQMLIVVSVALAAFGCRRAGQEPDLCSVPRIKEAKALALTYDARAHIVWAGGAMSAAGEMTGPEMTETYGFTAVAYDPSGGDTDNWGMTFDGSWEVTPVFPPLGIDVAIDLCDVGMDVSYAWWLVQRAGLASSFYRWELLLPLIPGVEHPLFIFATAGGYVILDTATSEISVETFAGTLAAGRKPAWAELREKQPE